MFRLKGAVVGLGVGMIVLLGSAPAQAVNDLALTVPPESAMVMPGETVEVTLVVSNLAAAINGVQVFLQFDDTLLVFSGVTPNSGIGTGWTEIGESESNGEVDYVVVMLGGSTAAAHTVATLQFVALIPGTTTVSFRADDPPFVTKLTRASDGSDILPNKQDSSTIVISCDDLNECTTETFGGVSCMFSNVSAGTACGDPADSPCDNPDTCDGAGACQPNFEPASFECRPSVGDCDPAEFCTGAAAQCPVDLLDPLGTECRASLGDCDPAEECTGSFADCPADLLDPAGTVCRASAGPCDLAEECTGVDAECPADESVLDGTPCPDGFFCNGDETCLGGLCEPGPDPCPGESCDEAADACCVVYPYGDANLTGVVDVDDILLVLAGFEEPDVYPEADIAPCGGNDVIDVDDILAVLDAFVGVLSCPDPCVP